MTDCTIYRPVGLLAVNPSALGQESPISEAIRLPVVTSPAPGIALVEIGNGGPLEHHVGACESYDGIKTQVLAALALPDVHTVLLSIDSPGGLVAGCFDTVTEIREAAAKAGKRIVAYIDAQATSAAYALCLAADYIAIPPTGLTGSIGVIETLLDATRQDAAMGLQFRVIASGERKADRNPHVAFAEREAGFAAEFSQVEAVAQVFFDLVAECRPLNSEQVRSLQAGLFVGAQAVQAGLADSVLTLNQTIAMLASEPVNSASPTVTTPLENPIMNVAQLKSALANPGKDWSDKDKDEAKRMLASLSAESDKPADDDKKDEPDPKAESDKPADEDKKDEPDPKAESDKPADHKEPDGDEAKKAATSATTSATVAETAAKAALLATRPDFSAEQRKSLQSSSLSMVLDATQNWPVSIHTSSTPKGHVAGALAALNTSTTDQPAPITTSNAEGGLPAADAQALAARMGVATETNVQPRWNGTYFEIPAMSAAQQAAYLNSKKGAK